MRLENEDLKKTVEINKQILNQILGAHSINIKDLIQNNLWEAEKQIE